MSRVKRGYTTLTGVCSTTHLSDAVEEQVPQHHFPPQVQEYPGDDGHRYVREQRQQEQGAQDGAVDDEARQTRLRDVVNRLLAKPMWAGMEKEV
jgi:hypothetical protein